MAQVIVLPGIERREFIGTGPTVQGLVDGAIESGVRNLILIGIRPTGELYIAAQENDVDRTVGRLMRAVTILADCEINHDYVVETETEGDK